MFFSLITKNSNWEILTKNLVTFKRQDGIKVFGVHWKIWYLGGEGFNEKPISRGDCLKSRAWTRKRGVFFLEGVDTQMHTMAFLNLYQHAKNQLISSNHSWDIADLRVF